MQISFTKNPETRKLNKVVIVPCAHCGKPTKCMGQKPWRTSLTQAKAGRACCSEECVEKLKIKGWREGGRQLAEYNSTEGRILKMLNNPMKNKDVVEKMRQTKSLNGTLRKAPQNRGGNGHGPTMAQEMLAKALGWPMEVAIPTAPYAPAGKKRLHQKKHGYPTCYKVDIANPDKKIAVEVDGASHVGSRVIADQKKAECLKELGWKVLRLSNRQIEADLAGSVRTVLSII